MAEKMAFLRKKGGAKNTQGTPLVPVLSADDGNVIQSGSYSGQPSWQAFDGLWSTSWSHSANAVPAYIGYSLSTAQKVIRCVVGERQAATLGCFRVKVQASNDGTNWTDVSGELNINADVFSAQNEVEIKVDTNGASYTKYRLYYSQKGSGGLYPTLARLQFYGE